MFSESYHQILRFVLLARTQDASICNYYFFVQVILLSATMPADVLEVTKRFMRDPIRILVKKEELTLEGIKQFYVQVEKEVRTCDSV